MVLRTQPVQSVGSLLNPQTPLQAPQAPLPNTDVTGLPSQNPMQEQMAHLLKNPAASAFMLNMATALLGQRGLAESMGQGLGGMGRFAAAKGAAETEAEKEARRRFESDRSFELQKQAAARAGGKGKDPADTTIGGAKFYSRVDDLMKGMLDAAEFNDEEVNYAQLRGRAMIAAMAEFGETSIASAYQGLSPEGRAKLEERVGAGGPAAWEMLQKQSSVVAGLPDVKADSQGPAPLSSPPTPNTPMINTPGSDIATPGAGEQLKQLWKDLGDRKLNL